MKREFQEYKTEAREILARSLDDAVRAELVIKKMIRRRKQIPSDPFFVSHEGEIFVYISDGRTLSRLVVFGAGANVKRVEEITPSKCVFLCKKKK